MIQYTKHHLPPNFPVLGLQTTFPNIPQHHLLLFMVPPNARSSLAETRPLAVFESGAAALAKGVVRMQLSW